MLMTSALKLDAYDLYTKDLMLTTSALRLDAYDRCT